MKCPTHFMETEKKKSPNSYGNSNDPGQPKQFLRVKTGPKVSPNLILRYSMQG